VRIAFASACLAGLLVGSGASGDCGSDNSAACRNKVVPTADNLLLQVNGNLGLASGGRKSAGRFASEKDVNSTAEELLTGAHCDKPCKLHGESHTCGARAQWVAGIGKPAALDTLTAALDYVNRECFGQCACNTTDFPWLQSDLPCHTAQAGQQCFKAVEWAMTHGIRLHPEWYEGLTSGSTFEQFQDWLHRKGMEQCHKPCALCQTTTIGEACWDEVQAVAEDQQLPVDFHVEELQAMLNRTNSSTTCPMPCARCRAAVPGDVCYIGVMWAMQHGIADHPDWYPSLTPESPFEDFQEVLHGRNQERCAFPCRDSTIPKL